MQVLRQVANDVATFELLAALHERSCAEDFSERMRSACAPWVIPSRGVSASRTRSISFEMSERTTGVFLVLPSRMPSTC